MNVLEVSKLTKSFKKFHAISSVSLSLQKGEILGLLGPNGAGKTTFIQMLIGALTPTSGKVLYFGKDFEGQREQVLERVNFSSTYTNLPWDLSVKECFSFMSFLYKIPNRRKQIASIVKIFKLEDVYNQQIRELSAGQITRVNLAKAFLNSPEVLLLDEPTASLDPDIADYIRSFLLDYRKKHNTSMIFTSHNMSEVEEVCDRVVFLHKGKILSNDTPSNLAKSIEICHLELYIRKNLDLAVQYAKRARISYRKVGKERLVFDVKEQKIASFLQKMQEKGVHYTEISIDKPSLEDYFLKISQKK